jgi:hypothetical protein
MFCPMYIFQLAFVCTLEWQISKITPTTTTRQEGILEGFLCGDGVTGLFSRGYSQTVKQSKILLLLKTIVCPFTK